VPSPDPRIAEKFPAYVVVRLGGSSNVPILVELRPPHSQRVRDDALRGSVAGDLFEISFCLEGERLGRGERVADEATQFGLALAIFW